MKHFLLLAIVGAAAAVVFAMAPMPQPPQYLVHADQRTWAGLPNALNVISNLPLALVGLLGLLTIETREQFPYAVLFAGTLLTGFGSSYYHLSPGIARLVWDRLPMSIAFMGLLTGVLGDYVDGRIARALFAPLVSLGALSVIWWYWSELAGRGDLRLYALVQFGSLLAIAAMLVLYRGGPGDTRYLAWGLLTYGVAKVFEVFDESIFAALGSVVSGHTLKHVIAATGIGFVVLMLRARRLSSRVERSNRLAIESIAG